MTALYSIETAGVNSRPVVKPASGAYGGRMRRYRGSFTMAAQATTDNILLSQLPAGSFFAFGVLTASATLGTAVIAIGTSATHGSNGQYFAASTFTAANTPTMFGLAAAIGGAVLADTNVYLTIATAALPGAGTLIADIYATNA